MKVDGSASVREVLADEAPEPELVGVRDDRIRRVKHAATLRAPTVTELAVLAGDDPEPLVEAAERAIRIRRDREIVGGEEARVVGVLVVVGVDDVRDHLARAREWIVGQGVDDTAADHPVRRSRERRRQVRKPGRRGAAIVVREGQELAACSPARRVARARRPAMSLFDQLDGQTRPQLVDHRARGKCATVVDDEHLEAIERVVLSGEGRQAVPERVRSVVSRDDDGEVDRGSAHVAPPVIAPANSARSPGCT